MNNLTEYRTMTRKENNRTLKEIKAMMVGDSEFLRPMVKAVIQEVLEAEMAQAVGAEKGERAEGLSYRSGYYFRSLVTRVGKLELRVPQDRQGRFFHRDLRALPTQQESAGGGAHPDVHPRGIDSKGQSH